MAHQAPLSVEFSREECWSGYTVPSPGGLPNPGVEPGSPALQADSLLTEPPREHNLLVFQKQVRSPVMHALILSTFLGLTAVNGLNLFKFKFLLK